MTDKAFEFILTQLKNKIMEPFSRPWADGYSYYDEETDKTYLQEDVVIDIIEKAFSEVLEDKTNDRY